MSEVLETWMWTKADQASALLTRLVIEHEGVRHGCNCHVGYLPHSDGRLGLVFPPDPTRLYRSTEESRITFVMGVGVPTCELGLQPVRIAWSRLKAPVRRAIDHVDWVIAQNYYECDPLVANDPEMAALLGCIA